MKLTDEEKSLVIKCISKEQNRTVNNSYYESLSKVKDKLINKLVTTTNEYPNSEQIDNALDALYGDNSCNHTKVIQYLNSLT